MNISTTKREREDLGVMPESLFHRHIDNSYTYYFDVQETEKEEQDMMNEEEQTEKQLTKVWMAYRIPIVGNLHLDNIKKEVMQYLWNTDEENRLINLYNSGANKLFSSTEENSESKNIYKTFLSERIEVLKKVEDDFNTALM